MANVAGGTTIIVENLITRVSWTVDRAAFTRAVGALLRREGRALPTSMCARSRPPSKRSSTLSPTVSQNISDPPFRFQVMAKRRGIRC